MISLSSVECRERNLLSLSFSTCSSRVMGSESWPATRPQNATATRRATSALMALAMAVDSVTNGFVCPQRRPDFRTPFQTILTMTTPSFKECFLKICGCLPYFSCIFSVTRFCKNTHAISFFMNSDENLPRGLAYMTNVCVIVSSHCIWEWG